MQPRECGEWPGYGVTSGDVRPRGVGEWRGRQTQVRDDDAGRVEQHFIRAQDSLTRDNPVSLSVTWIRRNILILSSINGPEPGAPWSVVTVSRVKTNQTKPGFSH